MFYQTPTNPQVLIQMKFKHFRAPCEDENNPIMKYEPCNFPSLASLWQRTRRLRFVLCFHIDGYASFLRRRRLAPSVTSTYVTPFTLIGKMRWRNNKAPHWVEMSSMRVDKSDPEDKTTTIYIKGLQLSLQYYNHIRSCRHVMEILSRPK